MAEGQKSAVTEYYLNHGEWPGNRHRRQRQADRHQAPAVNSTDKKIDTKLEKPFYPISFRTDRPGFPPARE
ncbi:hypothetical protein BC454_10065 [Neisseria meningitidis]|nr:hypothetical protein BC454_10065 [Neisseria meningitidis]